MHSLSIKVVKRKKKGDKKKSKVTLAFRGPVSNGLLSVVLYIQTNKIRPFGLSRLENKTKKTKKKRRRLC